MKKLKFLLTSLAVIVTTLMYISNVAFGEEGFKDFRDEFSYEDYLKGIKEGWIGEDVSYEMLVELNNSSRIDNEISMLREELENSEYFYEVPYDVGLRPGDIIVTNGTSSAGLTGHAAIALGENEILHIPGFLNKVKVDTKSQFIKDYIKDKNSKIWVYRVINDKYGDLAARWAKNTYKDSNAKYMITTNLKSTDVTYCSKIVWQSYYFGVGAISVTDTNTTRIVKPYNLKSDSSKVEIRNEEFKGCLEERAVGALSFFMFN